MLFVTSGTAHAAGDADVAALQVALRGIGLYSQTIDGTAGPGTRAAVKRFQAARGLSADGVAGAATRAALGRRGGPSYGTRTLRLGHAGWDVAALQFRLAWRGFPSGTIDGAFGTQLKAAVRRFQAYSGVTADGTAGLQTLGLLRGAMPRSPIWLRDPLARGITDRFGPRGNRFHTGVDYPAPAGALVAAAGRGQVVFAGWDTGGYGNLVVIEHPLGVRSMYAHLSRVGVSRGSAVTAGATIGRVGSTGLSTGPHLHFELRRGGAALDPLTALRR
jgi:murein DD-endopeptidase MepM/ murein hydrolase activator NlpD